MGQTLRDSAPRGHSHAATRDLPQCQALAPFGMSERGERATAALVRHQAPGLGDPKVLCRGHRHTHASRDGPVLQERRAGSQHRAQQSWGALVVPPLLGAVPQGWWPLSSCPSTRPQGWGCSSGCGLRGTEKGTKRQVHQRRTAARASPRAAAATNPHVWGFPVSLQSSFNRKNPSLG